jgi:CheY-like chemotaxis protein
VAGRRTVRGTSIAVGSAWITMSDDSKPPRRGGTADAGAPLLDAVARRIEELSTAVVEQTERLLEKPTEVPGADLAAILEAARRSSELARELVELARRERDTAAAALLSVTRGSAAPPQQGFDSEPVRSHRRVKGDSDTRPRVVLLVEDEPLLLKTMCRMLEQYGHRVLPAASGLEGLAVAAREPTIDLVVTDLALPGMPGSELVRRLRAARPMLRVLYTSGWDPDSSGVTLADDGSEAFLSKPFTALELDGLLSELLGTPPLKLVERR